jgi:hypothetical protein
LFLGLVFGQILSASLMIKDDRSNRANHDGDEKVSTEREEVGFYSPPRAVMAEAVGRLGLSYDAQGGTKRIQARSDDEQDENRAEPKNEPLNA